MSAVAEIDARDAGGTTPPVVITPPTTEPDDPDRLVLALIAELYDAERTRREETRFVARFAAETRIRRAISALGVVVIGADELEHESGAPYAERIASEREGRS